MATKVFQVFLSIFLFSLALPLPSHASPSKPKADEKPSSFESIKHLEGGQKGQTLKGLQQLKAYLEAFGYLNYSLNQTGANDDDFDDSMEAAIKTYQLNHHLETTGTLDAQTLSAMAAPRCGVPDIIDGTNWMQAGQKRNRHTHNTLHTVAHYALFPGNLKWPPTKYHLTYGFPPGTGSVTISAFAGAFNIWASRTPFTFSQSEDLSSADIKIGFYRGDHGDGFPFEPNGGTLAHSFAPTDGRIHLNGDYSFSNSLIAGSFDLETLALHEIGHVLGLRHSQVQDAIMWPTLPPGQVKGLNADDIQGIKALYNYNQMFSYELVCY